MQPFKLVPSLSARIPGRITSPRGLDELKPQTDKICELQQLCSTQATMLLRICPSTNGYTVTLLHLVWSCAIAMNSIARRYPSYILKEHQGCCHERDASKGQTVLELVVKLAPKFHSRGSHVPSLTLPPFTCAGVLSQRASSERGTGSGTGNRAPKKPQKNENSEVSKSKKRKEIQGVQNCAAENPKAWHGDARRKRCQMKVILVETWNLASVFPALDAGQEPCGDAVPTNRRTFYQQEYENNDHISHMYGSPLDLRIFF